MSGQERKVTREHLARRAFVYVRQSTLRQVAENGESTRRQYDLRRRARSLGWSPDRICVIDSDLGLSGADSDREGFQRLVSEVSLGRAGIVLGLEVSRLVRNNADWHRLLELCAQSGTLILDEEGIYDPSDFNDRLLLGLKGTMSEAELHVIRSRLLGGLRAKAERGQLRCRLPVGFVYDPLDRVVLDPDAQVRDTLKTFFAVYERTGSARAVVVYFNKRSLAFPARPHHGPRKGELFWGQLTHGRAVLILHNPRYAGAFAWGRKRTRRINGRDHRVRLPREEWRVLITDHHPGYISWERYELNQATLARAARSWSRARSGPPREGSALLQGLAVCGKCGKRMSTHYDSRGRQAKPRYICRREGIDKGLPVCQSVPGTAVDAAVAELALELVRPQMLELALSAQDELQRRIDEADALRAKAVRRLEEEVELAERRHRMADPSNRLVVDVLEAEWNARLLRLQDALEEQERQRERERAELNERQRERIRSLATEFPRIWNDPATPVKERKRMLGHLIADATLVKGDDGISVGVRLRGGGVRRLTLPLPLSATDLYRTGPEVVALLDRLLADHTYAEIAAILNQRGVRTGRGNAFNARKVCVLRRDHGLKTRYERLRDRGMLTRREVAALLAIDPTAVNAMRRTGRLLGVNAGGNQWLYHGPAAMNETQSTVGRWGKSAAVGRGSNEVQYAQ